MATRNKLSAAKVKAITAVGRHSDGAGLYLRVSPSLTKSWSYRWKRKEGVGPDRKDRVHEYGLGPFPSVSLSAARDKADQCREAIATGTHPRDLFTPPSAHTFAQAAKEYMVLKHVHSQHPDNVAQWKHLIETRTAPWHTRDIASITVEDVLSLIAPVWEKTPEAARRAVTRMNAVFGLAVARGWRSDPSPAMWKGSLEWRLPKHEKAVVSHYASMPYADVPAFLLELRKRKSIAATMLEFIIFTACRTGEARRALHEEFDLEARTWTRPKAHMKTYGLDHTIPLSDEAIAVVAPLLANPTSPYVFPGRTEGQPCGPSVVRTFMGRMGLGSTKALPHGFRSSFRSYVRDETRFDRELAEIALGHKVGNRVEQSYARTEALERRRPMMQAWADHLEGRAPENVIPIGVRA